MYKVYLANKAELPPNHSHADRATASIHQPRLGHGYFKSPLIRLPSYNSTECQCSERIQNVKHLLHYTRMKDDKRESPGKLLYTPYCSLKREPQCCKNSSKRQRWPQAGGCYKVERRGRMPVSGDGRV